MTHKPKFKVGDSVSNETLRTEFKVATFGRIRKSNTYDCLVLISDHTNSLYNDEWVGNELHFTGMGGRGDQTLQTSQNRTLYNSETNGVELHLFELFSAGKYVYRGIVKLSRTPYKDWNKGDDGKNRWVWVFPVKPINNSRSASVTNASKTKETPKQINERPVVSAAKESKTKEAPQQMYAGSAANDSKTVNKQMNTKTSADAKQKKSNTGDHGKGYIKKLYPVFLTVFAIVGLLALAYFASEFDKKQKEIAVNETIMDAVIPVKTRYDIDDISVDTSKTDIEGCEVLKGCEQYYFFSDKFETLSNDKKLNVLEDLYKELCSIGRRKDSYEEFEVCIQTAKENYSLDEDRGKVALVKGNKTDLTTKRKGNYFQEQYETAAKTSGSGNNSGNSNTSTTERVKCSICNGTGSVKYYYGASELEAILSGHNDYEWGPCTSCNGTGYNTVRVSAGSSNSNTVICPSCLNRVSGLITKKDAAGVSRTWCSSCWSGYDDIMGDY